MSTLNALRPVTALLLLAGAVGAWAERADRTRPMALESDKPCTVNLLRQTSICSGNVVVSQGTLQIRADRLELHETPEGYQMAQATGSPGKPATYRQKRDGVADEFVEGQAQRIDYDSRAGTLRFDGAAVVRRLRGNTVADEIHGQQITWDSVAESFNVQGGATTSANPGGRVRAVIAPRLPADAASAAPADGSALKTTPSLGDRR